MNKNEQNASFIFVCRKTKLKEATVAKPSQYAPLLPTPRALNKETGTEAQPEANRRTLLSKTIGINNSRFESYYLKLSKNKFVKIIN